MLRLNIIIRSYLQISPYLVVLNSVFNLYPTIKPHALIFITAYGNEYLYMILNGPTFRNYCSSCLRAFTIVFIFEQFQHKCIFNK